MRKIQDKSIKNMDLKIEFLGLFCGGTFYNVLNMHSNIYLKYMLI